jgi:hypothetical protein
MDNENALPEKIELTPLEDAQLTNIVAQQRILELELELARRKDESATLRLENIHARWSDATAQRLGLNRDDLARYRKDSQGVFVLQPSEGDEDAEEQATA